MTEQKQKMKVLLVDDHAMVREGIRALLDAKPDLEVVGEASNGQQAVEFVQKLQPDVVLMDVSMPEMNGIEATRRIVGLNSDIRIIGLTVHESQEYFFQMLAAGACGYILKGATADELVEAIRSSMEGGVSLTPVMTAQLVKQFLRYRDPLLPDDDHGLTTREMEVLRLIATGLTNQEVADQLQLSIHTVQSHRAHIMRKLGLEHRHQLMKYAIRHGYTDELA